jgi:hypothetical protein
MLRLTKLHRAGGIPFMQMLATIHIKDLIINSNFFVMKKEIQNRIVRRAFVIETLSSFAFCCIAPANIFGSEKMQPIKSLDDGHKFFNKSEMSIKEIYNFSFKQWYIPAMKNLRDQIGQEKFIELLKESSNKIHLSAKNKGDYNKRTFNKWSSLVKKVNKSMNDRLTYEIIVDTDDKLEIKFTECLWAKTFREAEASDIGFAGVCYQDYALTESYNPKIKLIREKTLMQGNECCHFIWFIEK